MPDADSRTGPYRVSGGGPLDGRSVPYRGEFFEEGGVYRLTSVGYVFLGHASRRCAGCGGWLVPRASEPLATCPLCGAAREAPPEG